MFQDLIQQEENLYTMPLEPLETEVKAALLTRLDLHLTHDGESLYTDNLRVSLTSELLMVKVLKSKVSEEEITKIHQLTTLLKMNIKNLVELLILQNTPLSPKDFVQKVKEHQLSFKFLTSYLTDLKSLGLQFNESLINLTEDDDFFAIDCGTYLKFIPQTQYLKEKTINATLTDLEALTTHGEIKSWLNTIYRRHLLNNSFDSNAIHHVLDWMNQLTDFSVLKKSLSYDKAVAKSEEWVLLENQKLGISSSQDKEGKDIQTLLTQGPYTLLHLLSPDAKKREGAKMHNCIGRIHLTNPDIYSVRFKGKRVASICFRDRKAIEIKGPWNKAVELTHRNGVTKMLEFMNINYENSNDLSNIGLRNFTLLLERQTVKLVINEHDPLYNHPSGSIEISQLFEGVNFDERNLIKEQTVQRFNDPALVTRILDLLTEAEKSYVVCPLTNLMTKNTSEYSKHKIPKVYDLIKFYPQCKDAWKLSVLEIKNHKSQNFNLNRSVLEGAKALLNNLEHLPGETKIWRQFFNSLISWDSDIALHPKLLAPILGNFDTTEKLMEMLADYSKFKSFAYYAEEISQLQKAKSPSYGADTLELEEPHQCKICDNYKIYEDQSSLAQEYNDKLAEAEKISEEMEENFNFLVDFVNTAQGAYKTFHRYLLKDRSLDLVTGTMKKKSLEQYKSFIEDVQNFAESFAEITKDFKRLENIINELEAAHNDLEKIEREISSIRSQLSRLNGESCSGCKRCDGTNEECEDCGGEAESCGGEEIIDENCKLDPNFNYSFPLLTGYSRRLNLSFLPTLYQSLDDMAQEPKELMRHIIVFYQEYRLE